MARLLVQCCARCGAEHTSSGWFKNKAGEVLHKCPDGVIVGNASYDRNIPHSRPNVHIKEESDGAIPPG